MVPVEPPTTERTVPDLSRLRIQRADAPVVVRRGAKAPWVLLALALLGFCGWAYSTGRLDLTSGPSLPLVATAVVTPPGGVVAAPGAVEGNGYVYARRRAALSTVLSGRLVEVNVEEGTKVEAGQVVARIQHDDFDASLASAKRDVAVARAKKDELEHSLSQSRLELDRLKGDNAVLDDLVRQAEAESDRATSDLARNEDLYKRRVIEQGRYDALKAQAAAAAAVLAASKSKVLAGHSALLAWEGEIARRDSMIRTADAEIARASEAEHSAVILLEKTYVRAPWAGIVVHKDAEVGEVVAATGAGGNSRGSVATIIDPDTLEVQVELSEQRVGRIKEGDAARITLDSDPSKAYAGKVRQVWPTADRQKATVEMRVEFVERPAKLKPELGARVTFLAGDAPAPAAAPTKPRVPRRALVTVDGKTFAFVVSAGAVRRVEVVVAGPAGSSADADVEKGLVGGEVVVLDPSAALKDGDRVRTQEKR